MMIKRFTLFVSLLILATATYAQESKFAPKREFRGVWIATVQNIDWPTKAAVGVNPAAQQQELIQILDEHQKTGINAIMLQVRPSTDAFYAKGREQWSRFLTGKQGLAPEPFYDPLEFAIQEAHKRGMELHAWINPYRATTSLVDSLTSPDHITRKTPEWFFSYGDKKYFNPGIPEVRSYIVDVILDIVRNYDIDGIHFDDYFYPYPGKDPLPDSTAYMQYGQSFANIEDWRRNNVDVLIESLGENIRSEKRHVKFGISPFGIWRNLAQDSLGSESNGLSGYSALYADARKWVQEGWIDYVNPQLYFPFHYAAAPYEKLLDWWAANSFGKHVYIGQGVYRAMEDREGWRNRQQLPNQVRYLRENPNVQGSVYFSSKSLTNNLAGFRDSLQHNFYKYPALHPQMQWLDDTAPAAPSELKEKKFLIFKSNKKAKLRWERPQDEQVYGYVIYRFEEGEPLNLENPKHIVKVIFDHTLESYDDESIRKGKKYQYVVTAIDRLKNESAPSNAIKAKF
ncbi:family 10 glycosylhydrolase [uncultured Pontibacter sp.]|uniref:glycoside hydrolase family 10 protein n=1 Tax=uncultured Pontibacter sp. TaxID=453356 RepID=UPI00261DC76B|nr:family 10 glycosylhydrolase [uncultured Pontibacter sp.]